MISQAGPFCGYLLSVDLQSEFNAVYWRSDKCSFALNCASGRYCARLYCVQEFSQLKVLLKTRLLQAMGVCLRIVGLCPDSLSRTKRSDS